MFCRFKSRLLKQLHPALLRGGQCGLSSFLCSRRSSTASPPQGNGPVQAAAECGPAPLHGKCHCPRNSGQHRRHPQKIPARYRCAVWRSDTSFAKTIERHDKNRHTNTQPAASQPARRAARIMPPLPSSADTSAFCQRISEHPSAVHRAAAFPCFFCSSFHMDITPNMPKRLRCIFQKQRLASEQRLLLTAVPRPCRPWMQAAPTARRGCLAASPR